MKAASKRYDSEEFPASNLASSSSPTQSISFSNETRLLSTSQPYSTPQVLSTTLSPTTQAQEVHSSGFKSCLLSPIPSANTPIPSSLVMHIYLYISWNCASFK